MKSFVIATSVAAVLVVGILVGMKMDDDGPGGADESVSASQEARLSELEDKVVAVDRLREDVRALSDVVSKLDTREEEGAADPALAPGSTRRAGSPSPEGAAFDGEVVASSLKQLETPTGQEKFYDAVKDSFRRYQREEKLSRERRTTEIKAEIEELSQGPYGKYNLKVNSMAKWLDLNDRQKEFYHTQVAHYDALLLEVRDREKADPENRDKYRQEYDDLNGEFVSVFTDALLPEQVELFEAMPEHEKRPGNSKMMPRIFYRHELGADGDAAPALARTMGTAGGASASGSKRRRD